MNIIRNGFASVLGLLSLFLICVGLVIVYHQEPTPLLVEICIFFFALCLAGTCIYYFRPRARWDSRLLCTNCKQGGMLRPSSVADMRIHLLWWIFGGFFGALLFSYARKRMFYCESCARSCRIRTVGGWVALLWLSFYAFGIIGGFLYDSA